MKKFFMVELADGTPADKYKLVDGKLTTEEMSASWEDGVDGVAEMIEEAIAEKFNYSLGDNSWDVIGELLTNDSLITEAFYNFLYETGCLDNAAIATALDWLAFKEIDIEDIPLAVKRDGNTIFEIDEEVLSDIE